MKKLILFKTLKTQMAAFLFVGLMSTYGLNLSAQDEGGSTGGGDIQFGGKIGTSISWFSGQQPHNTIKQGLIAGAYGWYTFNENMAVQIEAYYFQAGGQLLEFDIPWQIGRTDWYNMKANNNSITMHNIEIPILFRYAYPLGDVKVFGNIGPSVGINLQTGINNQTTVWANSGAIHTYNDQKVITNSIERYNYGATAGVGFEIPVSDYHILIDFRYRYGINAIYKGYSYRGIPQVTGDLQNHCWYVTLGFGM